MPGTRIGSRCLHVTLSHGAQNREGEQRGYDIEDDYHDEHL